MSDFKSPSYDGMKTPFIVSIGSEQKFHLNSIQNFCGQLALNPTSYFVLVLACISAMVSLNTIPRILLSMSINIFKNTG